MSSQSHCAADITAIFIDVATKPHGGQRSALSRLGWHTHCGARPTRSREWGVRAGAGACSGNADFAYRVYCGNSRS